MKGNCEEERVLAYLRELGLLPLRIRALPPAKHVFTHKEWHMTGFLIRVDELADRGGRQEGEGLIFVDPKETRTNYPIPSAFAAYAEQVEMIRKPKK